MRYLLTFVFILVFGLSTYGESLNKVDNRYIIESFEPLSKQDQALISDAIGQTVQLEVLFADMNLYAVEIEGRSDKQNAYVLIELSELSFIRHAFQDQYLQKRERPDDIEYVEQWNLDRISAEAAWAITTGGSDALGREIVVAVIDDGFEITHEDFDGSLWTNKEEIPDNGIDDDQNGFVDDVNGANLRKRNGTHAVRRHGTGSAGIIGAKGNNAIGITGVNWDTQLMLLSESLRISDALMGYDYIYQERRRYNRSNGEEGSYVVVTNFSLGIDNEFGSDFPSWCELYDKLGSEGILSVCATTNNDSNIDMVGDMPATCPSEYLIAVSNVLRSDILATRTGKSAEHIELGAPGDDSYSLNTSGGYGTFGGTSASSPHVAGAIALMYSAPCLELAEAALEDPSTTALAIKEALLDGVDPLQSLQGTTMSGGRLNVYNSILQLTSFCEGSLGDLKVTATPSPVESILTVDYETPDLFTYEYTLYSVDGQRILSNRLNPPAFGLKRFEIDVSFLPNGIYFLEFGNENGRTTERFIKM